jgi:hypothetical protein
MLKSALEFAASLRFFELACVLVRLDHLAGHHRKPESQGDVIGCETLRSRLC